MAPQPPIGQPDYNAMLPILATYANRKGGGNSGDLSNILNPMMGLFSNSYTAPQVMSDEEIQRIYAPQTLSIRNSDDPVAVSILDYIERGYPAIQIKKIISDGVNKTGTIQLNDPSEINLYNKLVDDLFAESKTVDEQRYKIANEDTIYEKYGLRNPNEEFDAKQLFPEVFAGLETEKETIKKGVEPKLQAIRDKFAKPEDKMPQGLLKTASIEDFIKGKVDFKLPGNKKVSQQDKNFSRVLAKRLDDYVKGNPVQLSTTGKSQWMDNNTFASTAKQLEDLTGIKVQLPNQVQDMTTNKMRSTTGTTSRDDAFKKAQMKYQLELAGAPVTAHKVGNTGGAVTQIPVDNLRDPVQQQQKLIDLVQKKVQEGLKARGETPFNQDMLNRIILNKAMGG
jgi:hypothetical protein